MFPSLLPVNGASKKFLHGSEPIVARATSMSSSWMENPSNKDGFLLKHQLCPPFPVEGLQRHLYERATSLLLHAAC